MSDTDNTMILDTTKGKVVIEMRPDLAPKHVARIKELARRGFYDGIVFHRVIDGFMAQTGDPKGTGTGGSGQKLAAEFSKEKHVRGTVSMARANDPDSADSQFFICFAPAPFLDGKYTVWGKVAAGMEFIDAIKKGEPPSKFLNMFRVNSPPSQKLPASHQVASPLAAAEKTLEWLIAKRAMEAPRLYPAMPTREGSTSPLFTSDFTAASMVASGL